MIVHSILLHHGNLENSILTFASGKCKGRTAADLGGVAWRRARHILRSDIAT
jgi:hypothetical protein